MPIAVSGTQNNFLLSLSPELYLGTMTRRRRYRAEAVDTKLEQPLLRSEVIIDQHGGLDYKWEGLKFGFFCPVSSFALSLLLL